MEKKQYEKPEVIKIDFNFEEAIAASGCAMWAAPEYVESGDPECNE